MENKKEIVLISGMSGAGKSAVSRVLEDMGYFCMDNLPVSLIGDFVEMVETTNDIRYTQIALSTSAADFPEFLNSLKGEGLEVQVLFLDCEDRELLSRYKSTRRSHPLLLSNSANTLEEAISVERAMFQEYRQDSFFNLDTTYMSEKELKNRLIKHFGKTQDPTFSVSFISFGYKHGVPMDADLMVDVRFLPNPFWVAELRSLTGNDRAVYDYVMDNDQTREFLHYFLLFTNYAFREYAKEGKNHFTCAIGCTGGQHRSVAIANYLYDYYKDQYRCYLEHRDVDRDRKS
ncbi:MAG: RNase adapter RapZ [Solobacterium sp.]|nr:RNase adapter RapZ [Erysipelotrichaceae bacterium]MBQ1325789.1 RNase adapter RapZ [Solobacterium sp.]MBQ1382362.1 RNase adapter RapZ [Solobacterium sp.]MBQ2688773.1 RNase adapter RapZ [Solobacterium sp.]MBR2726521.1 RNase adapter RapZ [Solobacterium sp.]